MVLTNGTLPRHSDGVLVIGVTDWVTYRFRQCVENDDLALQNEREIDVLAWYL